MTEKLTSDLRILHAALRHGEVVAFPTDTVFGLGADAGNAEAIDRLRAIKGRDGAQPLQVLVSSMEQAQALAEFSPQAARLAERFWPGGLTLVLPKKPTPLLAENVCGATVGLRWPDNFLLAGYGGPIAATSANKAGESPLEDAEEIARKLGVLTLRADKQKKSSAASSVIEIKGNEVHFLREGSITRSMVEEIWNA